MEIPGRTSRRDRFFSLLGAVPARHWPLCSTSWRPITNIRTGSIFYKVDIDQEQDLAAVFGVRSVPTLLFIPLNGMPQMMTGGRPKSDLKRIIDEVLMGK